MRLWRFAVRVPPWLGPFFTSQSLVLEDLASSFAAVHGLETGMDVDRCRMGAGRAIASDTTVETRVLQPFCGHRKRTVAGKGFHFIFPYFSDRTTDNDSWRFPLPYVV